MNKQKLIAFLNENASFPRFIAVGACATLLDFIVYTVLLDNLGPLTAKGISMLCSICFSYILNKIWSFRSRHKRVLREVVRYALSQAVNIAVNVSVNYGMLLLTGHKTIAFVIATGFAMLVNYALQRFFVFRKETVE